MDFCDGVGVIVRGTYSLWPEVISGQPQVAVIPNLSSKFNLVKM